MFSVWRKPRSARGILLPEVWDRSIAKMPFIRLLSSAMRTHLVHLADRFLAEKTITGAHDFVITDEIRSAIALQACLPVLRLGLEPYSDFIEIIVYPDRFIAHRSHTDEAGVVHESIEELAGEAMQGGPVVLAWPDAAPTSDAPGFSVVIHEFVHKLDMLDGEADGIPPLSSRARARWADTIDAAFEQFCERLEMIERAIPANVDPESEAADQFFASLPLDPYAATDVAEFFAVAAESFFTQPKAFANHFPDLYALFTEYFGYPERTKDI